MTSFDPEERRSLIRRGLRLEYVTMGWNVVGVPVLLASAIAAARSVRSVRPRLRDRDISQTFREEPGPKEWSENDTSL